MSIIRLFVGIDPGLNGGIVCIDDEQNVIYKEVMPVFKQGKTQYDMKGVHDMFCHIISMTETSEDVYVMLEKAYVRPVSGKRACFMNGYGYGLLEGIMLSIGFSYEIVTPQTWMKEVLTGMNTKDKKVSIIFCKKKWPNEDWTATERSIKPHDGLTDAAAIALYGYRRNR